MTSLIRWMRRWTPPPHRHLLALPTTAYRSPPYHPSPLESLLRAQLADGPWSGDTQPGPRHRYDLPSSLPWLPPLLSHRLTAPGALGPAGERCREDRPVETSRAEALIAPWPDMAESSATYRAGGAASCGLDRHQGLVLPASGLEVTSSQNPPAVPPVIQALPAVIWRGVQTRRGACGFEPPGMETRTQTHRGYSWG